MQEVDSVTQSVDNFAQLIAQSGNPSSFRGHVDLLSEFIQKNDIDPSAAFDYVKRRVDEIKPGLSKFIFTTTEDMPVENKAYGGRIGFADGMPKEGIETLLPKPKPSEMMQGVDKTIQSIDNFAQLIAQSGSP